jgi:16S rRNA (cytidine1402-2'-O)-methyltransferase
MLYICPTPIGNLTDVTLRVLEVLKHVELVACEDTRHTRILLDRYGIVARLMSFHDYNEDERLSALLPLLREGRDVALVSDAGMPGLSDPGFSLVRACAAEDIPVTVLPGPSSVATALVLSGLPADRFAFVGFLARGKTKLIAQVAVFDGTGAAVVAFESPRRLRKSLEAISERWPSRHLAVCRELTKIHEEAVRGTAPEVLERLGDPVRGEIVLVLEPAGGQPTSRASASSGTEAAPDSGLGLAAAVLEARAREALGQMLAQGMGTKVAASIVAGLTGLPARRAYALALEARGDRAQQS